ncbi:unnamed protein product [Caenorhabditis angaria]|uniref:Uncharacterized protein n=1 Tax=Caenorhabditis angaria TaxID=860376 RepID=A0A9P1J142_9PELO|nr:unnamed protein product [Caenorhabditis angaria]
MADSLLDNYNPLYDIHLRQYFALPHMQKHLQKMGLLESTLNLHGDEVYARHHAMMDMMLKNREAQLMKMAELRKKLDAAEKVEICRRIRTGQSPESYRRGKPSRSLSRSRAAQKGGRQRRFSNSFEDKDFVQDIEQKNTDPLDYDTRDPYKRLSANAKRFNYLHKLDDPTLIAYKDNIKKQLQRLERFREISFGPHSVARQPPPPQTSWFFRRRSILNMRGRKATPHVGNKLNASGDSRTSCPPTTRKRRDSNPRLPPINGQKIKPIKPQAAQAGFTKLPPTGKGKSPARGRPATKRVTTTTTTTTTTSSKPVERTPLPTVTGHAMLGAGAAAVAAGAAAVAATQLVSEKPVAQHTPTPPSSPVLETQKTFDLASPNEENKDIEFPDSPTLENRIATPAASEHQEEYGAHVNEAFADEPIQQQDDHESVKSGATDDEIHIPKNQDRDETESESEPEYAEEDDEVQRAFADDETEQPREIPELKVDYYQNTEEEEHVIQKREVEDEPTEHQENQNHDEIVVQVTSPPNEIESSEYVRHESVESPIQSINVSASQAVPEEQHADHVESPELSETAGSVRHSPIQSVHIPHEEVISPYSEQITSSVEEQFVKPIESEHQDVTSSSPVQSIHEDHISSVAHSVHEAYVACPAQSVHEEVAPSTVQSVHEEIAPSPVQSVHEGGAPSPVQSLHEQVAQSPVQSVHEEIAPSPVQSIHEDHISSVAHSVHEAYVACPAQSVHEEVAPSTVQSVHEEVAPSPVQSVHEEVAPSPVQSFHEEVAPSPVQSVHEEIAPSPMQSFHEESAPSPVQSIHEEAALSPVQSLHEQVAHSPAEPVHEEPIAASPVGSVHQEVAASPAPSEDSRAQSVNDEPIAASPVHQEVAASPAPSVHSNFEHSASPVHVETSHENDAVSPVQSVHDETVLEQASPVSSVQDEIAAASPAQSIHEHSSIENSVIVSSVQSFIEQPASPAQSVHEEETRSVHEVNSSPVPSVTITHDDSGIEHPFEDEERPQSLVESENVLEHVSASPVQSEQSAPVSPAAQSPVQSVHEDVPASPVQSIHEQESHEEVASSPVQSIHESHAEQAHSPVPSSHKDHAASPVQSAPVSPAAQSPVQSVHSEHISFENRIENDAANEAASLIEEALSEAPAIIDLVNKIEENEFAKDPEAYELNYDSNTDQMTQSIYQPNDEENEQESDDEHKVQTETQEWDDGTQHIKQTIAEYTSDDGTSHFSQTVTVVTDQLVNQQNTDDNGSTDSLIIHDEPSDYQMTQSYYQPRDEHFTEKTVTTTTTTTVIKSGVDEDLKNNNDDEDQSNETHSENGNAPQAAQVAMSNGLPTSGILVDDEDEGNISSL